MSASRAPFCPSLSLGFHSCQLWMSVILWTDVLWWRTQTPAEAAMCEAAGLPAGTGSFVTRGRGNAQSWSSCSHGAGRRMSRTKAKANISQVSLCSWLMSPAYALPVT